jgi:hypothetical protein
MVFSDDFALACNYISEGERNELVVKSEEVG